MRKFLFYFFFFFFFFRNPFPFSVCLTDVCNICSNTVHQAETEETLLRLALVPECIDVPSLIRKFFSDEKVSKKCCSNGNVPVNRATTLGFSSAILILQLKRFIWQG